MYPLFWFIKAVEKEGVTAKPLGVKEDDSHGSFAQTYKDSLITGLSTVFFIAGLLAGGW